MKNRNSWSSLGLVALFCLGLSLHLSGLPAGEQNTDRQSGASAPPRELLSDESDLPAMLLLAAEDSDSTVPIPLDQPKELKSTVPEPRDQVGKPRMTPEAFANPEEAVPLPNGSVPHEALIRKFIEVDMKDSSKEEQEIWFQLLRNESPGLARNLLNLRKDFGSSFTPSDLSLENTIGPAPPEMEVEEQTNITPSRTISPNIDLESAELTELKTLWTTVRNMAMFNIGQAHISGYKRFEFISTDEMPIPADEEHEELTTAPTGTYRLDLSQGKLRETGRELDLALKVSGWLEVASQESGLSYYTRNGCFSLSANRQIVLKVGTHEFELSPAINIPLSATDIEISDTGLVTALVENDVTELGQLQIFRFPNATSLYYLGKGIYYGSRSSGAPVMAEPLPGMIQQGFLEDSNVEEEVEITNLDRYYKQWQTGLKLITEYPLLPTE
ncbi:Flagellar basal-body rod protein FlgG [Polystyrenella longa]|uniref:Flagellar basal-body rod protein FlgG n=1 Tax=Polystyrenella longa TaxID=2528007 RepID=A0A518CHE3_9PLAN|nr:flagellar hook basal-body protein [Polystyrenella longa]QDU78647.1 Flagellar basal-body rod protein FlgG [Polystyrenella longa]